MQGPQEDAPSRLVENEEVIPQAPRTMGATCLTMDGVQWKRIWKILNYVRANVRLSLIVVLRSREACMIAPSDDVKPKTVKQTLSSPASKEWRVAMQDEIESTRINHVSDLVDLSTRTQDYWKQMGYLSQAKGE